MGGEKTAIYITASPSKKKAAEFRSYIIFSKTKKSREISRFLEIPRLPALAPASHAEFATAKSDSYNVISAVAETGIALA
jgi:hypothetical protein